MSERIFTLNKKVSNANNNDSQNQKSYHCDSIMNLESNNDNSENYWKKIYSKNKSSDKSIFIYKKLKRKLNYFIFRNDSNWF